MKKYSGFTLVELMMTIAVLGIVTAVALPSFDDMIKRNRATTNANNLLASLNFARGEAANRGVNVQVAPLVLGTDWSAGWQVSADLDNNGSFADAGELIRVFEGINNHSSLNVTVGPGTIVFESSGELTPPANFTFDLRANNCTTGKEYVRTLSILPSGLVTGINKSNC